MVSNLLDKQECSCTTTEHTPLGKRVIILSLVGKKEKCYTKCHIVFTFKILVAFSFSELDNLNLPTPTNTSLPCELKQKLNDRLSQLKASKRQNLLSQGTFFQTTRSLPLTYCQYPINNYFNLEPKAAVFTLLTEHRCLAGGKFCGENDMSVYDRQDGWFSFLIS